MAFKGLKRVSAFSAQTASQHAPPTSSEILSTFISLSLSLNGWILSLDIEEI